MYSTYLDFLGNQFLSAPMLFVMDGTWAYLVWLVTHSFFSPSSRLSLVWSSSWLPSLAAVEPSERTTAWWLRWDPTSLLQSWATPALSNYFFKNAACFILPLPSLFFNNTPSQSNVRLTCSQCKQAAFHFKILSRPSLFRAYEEILNVGFSYRWQREEGERRGDLRYRCDYLSSISFWMYAVCSVARNYLYLRIGGRDCGLRLAEWRRRGPYGEHEQGALPVQQHGSRGRHADVGHNAARGEGRVYAVFFFLVFSFYYLTRNVSI